MATKIVTKNSSTASAVPTASDLVQGELAVNVADKRLFTEDNGGAIVELGTNPSTIDINAGSIDGTAIGASSASTGAFTTLTATGAFTSRGIDDNADATAITIDSSENVGIGNSSPAGYGKFVVQGTGNLINANASSGAAAFQLYEGGQGRFAIETLNGSAGAKFLLAGTERMRIDSSGNVGIGTSSPSAKLHLKDTTGSAVNLLRLETGWDNPSGNKSIVWTDATNALGRISVDYTAPKAKMRFGSLYNSGYQTGDVMTLTADGNVGIGTDSPAGALHLRDTTPHLYIQSDDGQSSKLLFGDAADNSRGGFEYTSSDAMIFMTNNLSEKMRIDSSGNVGLYDGQYINWRLAPNSTYRGGIRCDSSANMSFETGSGGSEAMRIDSSGNLAVGDSNAYTHRLFVKGVGTNEAVGLAVGTNGNNIIRFYNSGLGTAGAITVASGGTTVAYNTSSDQRLKENIADADDAGSKIDAIQVRKFNWKADGSHQDYGMIAQELQAVAPEAVSGDADSEEMMGVDYSKLVPMLIKEIQSLRNRVAQLEE